MPNNITPLATIHFLDFRSVIEYAASVSRATALEDRWVRSMRWFRFYHKRDVPGLTFPASRLRSSLTWVFVSISAGESLVRSTTHGLQDPRRHIADGRKPYPLAPQ